jgi:hypothetical protein
MEFIGSDELRGWLTAGTGGANEGCGCVGAAVNGRLVGILGWGPAAGALTSGLDLGLVGSTDVAEREGPSLDATSAFLSTKRLYSYFAVWNISHHNNEDGG